MPLLNIVGITRLNTTLYVAFVFMQPEMKKIYAWTLQQLQEAARKDTRNNGYQLRSSPNDSYYVVALPQESMYNGSSLFDYGLDNPYNDLIDDFDSYLEYGKRYQNRTALEDAVYG